MINDDTSIMIDDGLAILDFPDNLFANSNDQSSINDMTSNDTINNTFIVTISSNTISSTQLYINKMIYCFAEPAYYKIMVPP